MLETAGRGSPPRPRGHNAPLGCVLLALALLAVVAVVLSAASVRSTAFTTQVSSSIPVQLGAAGRDDPRGQQAETAFLDQLQAAHLPITARTTTLANALCIVLSAGGTGNADASMMIQNVTGMSDSQSTTFVSAARATVCHPRW
jgi:hypothetical protein